MFNYTFNRTEWKIFAAVSFIISQGKKDSLPMWQYFFRWFSCCSIWCWTASNKQPIATHTFRCRQIHNRCGAHTTPTERCEVYRITMEFTPKERKKTLVVRPLHKNRLWIGCRNRICSLFSHTNEFRCSNRQKSLLT